MPNVDPLFHMDENYMWRWYIPDARGRLSFMSTESFFYFEEARRDYEAVRQRFSA